MKKTRTIKVSDTAYIVKVTVKNTGDNYNQFASIFKGDNSLPLFGTCFKNTSTNKEITNWATERVNASHNQNILEPKKEIMKTTHTPGPWIVANSGGTVIFHNGTRYEQICELEKTPLKITPEIEANARLIAAAPEMLFLIEELAASSESKMMTNTGLRRNAIELLNKIKQDR